MITNFNKYLDKIKEIEKSIDDSRNNISKETENIAKYNKYIDDIKTELQNKFFDYLKKEISKYLDVIYDKKYNMYIFLIDDDFGFYITINKHAMRADFFKTFKNVRGNWQNSTSYDEDNYYYEDNNFNEFIKNYIEKLKKDNIKRKKDKEKRIIKKSAKKYNL